MGVAEASVGARESHRVLPGIHTFGLSVGQGPGRAKSLVAKVGGAAEETLHLGEHSASRPFWEWVQSRESTRSLLATDARQTTLYRKTIRRRLKEEYPLRTSSTRRSTIRS
jgi:hypothetical protein